MPRYTKTMDRERRKNKEQKNIQGNEKNVSKHNKISKEGTRKARKEAFERKSKNGTK